VRYDPYSGRQMVLGQHSAFFFMVCLNQNEEVAGCTVVLLETSQMGTNSTMKVV